MNKEKLIESLFFGAGQLFLVVAFILLLLEPEGVLLTPGAPRFPAIVHAITLGFLATLTMGIHYRILPRLFRRKMAWETGQWVVWGVHVIGVGMMIIGFAAGNKGLVYWGGHYLVSTAVMIFIVQSLVTAYRAPRKGARMSYLIPALGMVATVGMGAMLAYDLQFGTYHIYHYGFIVPHLLMGGYLFMIPMILFPYYAVPMLREEGVLPVRMLPILLIIIGGFSAFSIAYGWNTDHQAMLLLGWFDLLAVMALMIIQERKIASLSPNLTAVSNLRFFGWLGITTMIFFYLISLALGREVNFNRLVVGGGLFFLLVPIIPSFLFFTRNYQEVFQGIPANRNTEQGLFILHGVTGSAAALTYFLEIHAGIYLSLFGILLLLVFQAKQTFLNLKNPNTLEP